MGLLFTIAAGPRQQSHSLVRVLDSKLPQPGGPGPRIYIPQEQGGPLIAPGTEFPFRRLLRLSGLRWRYSNPPPHELASFSKSKSKLCYDRRAVGRLSWNKAPIWGLRPDLDYCQTVAGLLMWDALSDERTGLPFAIATGPRQRSYFRVPVP
jgi:hypothetical protein